MSPQEAEGFLHSAVSVLVAIEDAEKAPSRAIPRDILTIGEAQVLLGALVELISLTYPMLVESVPSAADLAMLNYRQSS